jgi:uncharacterized membrane protein required for colicin V production
MLVVFTLGIMGIVAFMQYRNGLFTSVAMIIQVLLAGLVAFSFWEPIADELDAYWSDGRMAGYEDAIVLVGLFCLTLGGLRLVTNRLNKMMIDFNWHVQQVGGPAAGLITGYLVSGFLVCVFQTLPIEENFLTFTMRKTDEPGLRRYLPADRVWLALMRHAGAYPLAWTEEKEDAENPFDRWATFDREGTFELRYARYRRHTDKRGPMNYQGELDRELGRRQ